MHYLDEFVTLNTSNLLILLSTIFISYTCFTFFKYGFRVSVNCWFCNTWLKVPYSQRNSFICTSCQQYNGFTENGDYNRIITDQYDTSDVVFSKNQTSNGLCKDCNQSQLRKVKQLAKFTPINEDNYDAEIDHFQKQLEETDKLCRSCNRRVKKIIARQNLNLLFNPILGRRRLDLFFLQQKRLITKQIKQIYILNIVKCLLVITTVMILMKIVKIPKEFYEFLTPHVWINEKNAFTLITCVLQVVLLFFDAQSNIWTRMNRFTSWIIVILPLLWTFNKRYTIYINSIRILSSIFQVITLLPTTRLIQAKPTVKNCHFKKICHPHEDLSDDEGEDQFNENYAPFNATFNSYTARSPPTANSASFLMRNSYTKPLNLDLDSDLNDLHLSKNWRSGFATRTAPISVNYSAVRPTRQLLTPPILKIATRNDVNDHNVKSHSFSHQPVNLLSPKAGYESQPTNLFVTNSLGNCALNQRQCPSPYHSTLQVSGYFMEPKQCRGVNNVAFSGMFYNNYIPKPRICNSVDGERNIGNKMFKTRNMELFNETNVVRRTI